jgi:hypothetical protein
MEESKQDQNTDQDKASTGTQAREKQTQRHVPMSALPAAGKGHLGKNHEMTTVTTGQHPGSVHRTHMSGSCLWIGKVWDLPSTSTTPTESQLRAKHCVEVSDGGDSRIRALHLDTWKHVGSAWGRCLKAVACEDCLTGRWAVNVRGERQLWGGHWSQEVLVSGKEVGNNGRDIGRRAAQGSDTSGKHKVHLY